MAVKETIEQKLQEAFQPSALEVIDESHLHQGHGGWREGGETHFRVIITADAFASMTRLQRHRAVNDALSAELESGVHALAIKADA